MAWRPRRRRGRRERFPKPVSLGRIPAASGFMPVPQMGSEPIYIEPAEIEAIRLVDFEGLSQEEAGDRMGVSRGSVWRLLKSGKKNGRSTNQGKTTHHFQPTSPKISTAN